MERNQLMSIEAQAAVVALAATQLSAETFRATVKELVQLGNGGEIPSTSAGQERPAAIAPSSASSSASAELDEGRRLRSFDQSGFDVASEPAGAWQPSPPGTTTRPGSSGRQLAVGARPNRKPMELIKFEKTTLCVPKELFRAASAKLGGDVATRERARGFARLAPAGTTNRSSWVQDQLKQAIGAA